MPGCLDAEGLEWIWGGEHYGERGLEEILTRSSFRSSADFVSSGLCCCLHWLDFCLYVARSHFVFPSVFLSSFVIALHSWTLDSLFWSFLECEYIGRNVTVHLAALS